MRDPALPYREISPVFEKPTHNLRTPEDSLTLWQFMTITWMTPLIALGSQRQLDGDDVWSLGYEFQHTRLHENFRRLRGSVIKRLFYANGIDLVLTSVLEVIELVASKDMVFLMFEVDQ